MKDFNVSRNQPGCAASPATPPAEPSAAQRVFDAVQPFIFEQDEEEVRELIEEALSPVAVKP